MACTVVLVRRVRGLDTIEGALEITAHGRAHRLETGDAVHFDASFPHSYRAIGPDPAQALVVTTRPHGAPA